ncbi:TetR family transcriptional regulator [Solitalea lacus]|uniref:TetR family transcriptional regulator n=1 Tax=Solitalea lacus TaxID=2911172 RepID=UPI001EDBA45D|nr:TetR family transcriptional regulator [Solitalea lacus]UKJ06819.1 TetR family transcriptional regulator [Solitalea lacus]
MGRKSLKEDRRKEIIQVFYQVAKKDGLENTSIAKIAKVMDINPSLIIHYFQTKEDLVYGLIDFILDKYMMIYGNYTNKHGSVEILLKVIDNMFSKKWNTLIDDGVFYSCYSLIFRQKKIKKKYKLLHDSLRDALAELIQKCKEKDALNVQDPRFTSEIIFVLLDGAYYYLSLVDSKDEYNLKLEQYKQQALKMVGLDDFAVSHINTNDRI